MILILSACNNESHQPDEVTGFLNHGDSATYVGVDQCRSCHQDIYESYMHTGMGLSYDLATKTKSSADFEHSTLCDAASGFCYTAFWKGEEFWMKEFRLEGSDTVHQREQKIHYVIGSGQHTNSHIYSINGYLHQAPMTFYTQEHKWDLPPGYEKGNNTRFERKIGLECLSCHNSFPGMVLGSENKYTSVPNGISCERCHGPGSIHVKRKLAGERIDTSKYIDYTIVNPGKLSVEQQFDLCQRCHLQGNAVLKDGKSFYDFRPGMLLSDFWTVFLPKYEGAEDEFIMASHADRLKMSKCFMMTSGKVKDTTSLKPYKNSLTCVTCHNPHVSVKKTGEKIFNDACKKCHTPPKQDCREKPEMRAKVNDNCVKCHMPRSGSIDIPHVTVTDHFIRTPKKEKAGEKSGKLKKFIGLYAINEEKPPAEVKVKAYLYQYEKFEKAPYYLDSANWILNTEIDPRKGYETWIHYYFIRNDYEAITRLISLYLDTEKLLTTMLVDKSWDNRHAWTAYRIGEAYLNKGDAGMAVRFHKKAVDLSPFNLEFRNKLGVALVQTGKMEDAKKQFSFILEENPNTATAWCNLGYLELLEQNDKKAEEKLRKALALDPDYELAMLNLLNLYLYRKDAEGYKKTLLQFEKKFPTNPSLPELRKMKV